MKSKNIIVIKRIDIYFLNVLACKISSFDRFARQHASPIVTKPISMSLVLQLERDRLLNPYIFNLNDKAPLPPRG